MTADGAGTAEHHQVVVVGAGPAGLSAAAVLRRRRFEVLVLERTAAVAARWRTRYDPLRLNTARRLSTLPGYGLSRRCGRYPTRDDFITYLEGYAAHHRLTVRFGTEVGRIDPGPGRFWRLETSTGPLAARYVGVATGYDAVPRMPQGPGRSTFSGELRHAAGFHRPQDYPGRTVLVVGAGNSGIDIAGHLVAAGADVTVSMRTPPTIVPRQWLGIPCQAWAVVADRLPAVVGDLAGRLIQWTVFGDLAPYWMPRPPEGFQTRYRPELAVVAVDDGWVAALKAGRTRVVAEIDRFEGPEVVLVDGARLRPDAVICATGYRRGLEPIVGHLGVLRPDGIPLHHGGRARASGRTGAVLRRFLDVERRSDPPDGRPGPSHRPVRRPGPGPFPSAEVDAGDGPGCPRQDGLRSGPPRRGTEAGSGPAAASLRKGGERQTLRKP